MQEQNNNPIFNTDINGDKIDWGGWKGFKAAVTTYAKAIFNKQLRRNLRIWRKEGAKLRSDGTITLDQGGTRTVSAIDPSDVTIKYSTPGGGFNVGWNRLAGKMGNFFGNIGNFFGNIHWPEIHPQFGWGAFFAPRGEG